MSARQRSLLAQAAEREAQERAGIVQPTAAERARTLYTPSTPGSARVSPGGTPAPSVPATPTTRASSLPVIPGSGQSEDLGGYATSEGGATPMATEEDRRPTPLAPEANPFVIGGPYPAVFKGASVALRQASLEAAVQTINNLTEWLSDHTVRGDTEFYKSAARPYGLSGALTALLSAVKDENVNVWAGPVEPDAGDSSDDEGGDGPSTPKGPKGPAATGPAWTPRPQISGPQDEDVAMQPAEPLPNAPRPTKARAPPRPQPKKPIRPFQPPPINMQTKPKRSYAQAAAKSPAKAGPIKPPGPPGWEWFDGHRNGARVQEWIPQTTFNYTVPGSAADKKKKAEKKMDWLSAGPTRRQLLLEFRGGATIDAPTAVRLMAYINQELGFKGFMLRVESMREAYKGHSLAMSDVATDAHIAAIRGCIEVHLFTGAGCLPKTEFSLTLPRSKAFMRITDVPFWNSTTDASHKMSAEHVKQYVRASPLSADILGAMAGEFRIHHTSDHSSTSTVFFDIWDSQSGARAKHLIGKTVMIRGRACKILTAPKREGVPWCKKCCKWGHPDVGCRSKTRVCERCGGPHEVGVHRLMCGACKGNPKAKPPVPPNRETACPHKRRCPNCFGDHLASDSRNCVFWKHKFDRNWIEAKYLEVRNARRSSPTAHPPTFS